MAQSYTLFANLIIKQSGGNIMKKSLLALAFIVVAAFTLSWAAGDGVRRSHPVQCYRLEYYGMKPDGKSTCRKYWSDRENTVTVEVVVLSRVTDGAHWVYECEEDVYDAGMKLVEQSRKSFRIPRGARLVDYINRYDRMPNCVTITEPGDDVPWHCPPCQACPMAPDCAPARCDTCMAVCDSICMSRPTPPRHHYRHGYRGYGRGCHGRSGCHGVYERRYEDCCHRDRGVCAGQCYEQYCPEDCCVR